MFASMMTGLNKDNVTGWLWSDRAWEVDVNMSPMTFIKNTDTIGGGTDVYGAVEGLLRTKTNVDVMVIFTDMQMYEIDSGTTRTFGNILTRYKKELNSNVQVIFWNLAGYDGGAPIKMNNGVMEVSGFSDKMVEVVGKMLKYNDPMVLVKEIEAVEL
jgi:hypothetical protein